MSPKKAIVRKENFGMLIWSPMLDAYFLPDDDVYEDVESIIESISTSSFTDNFKESFDKTLIEDIIEIGVNSGIKVIDNSLTNRLSAPLDVYFDYTHACNLQCSYCYNVNVDRNVTMSNDKIIQVLSEMSKNGVMRTHLAGGEPMINPEGFETYLKTAKAVGMNVSVNCNGTLLSKRTLNAVFNYDVITLTFSLDGYDAKSNDYYRGKGIFEKVRANARKSVDKKKSKGNGPKLQYKAVHMFDTLLEVYEGLIKVAIEDGMDRVQFHNPECSVNHDQNHYGNPEVIKGYYERVRHLMELRKKYSGKIEVWNVWNPITGCADIGLPEFRGCIGGQELIAIDAKGDIRPCLMNKFSFGNLFTDWGGKFSEFWQESEKLSQYQRLVEKVDSHCEGCNIYSQCRGGRKTRIITQNREGSSVKPIKLEDMVGYDPYCTMDFIKLNPEIELPQKRKYRLNHFRRVNMAHSL